MRSRLLFLGIIALVTLSLLVACAAPEGAVRVVSITDGDTIRVMWQGREEPVRFIGVDTPEIRPDPEPFGEEAHALVRNLLRGRRVWLEFDSELRDRHGRLLAYVWLSPPNEANYRDEMLNARLLVAGLADTIVVRPNVKYMTRFRDLRDAAQAAQRGQWRGGR